MGGFCSVCLSAKEQIKPGAWDDDLSCDSTVQKSRGGVPTTILIPDVLKQRQQRDKQRIRIAQSRHVSQDEEEEDDGDVDDDESDSANDETDSEQNDSSSMADLMSDSNSMDCANNGFIPFNASMDLLLSDTDCDEFDGNHQEDEDDDEDPLDDDEDGGEHDDDDDDANLLGESLFPSERDDSDGADDELLFENSCIDQPLIILTTLLRQETDGMLQFCPDKDNEPRLIKPSFAEQFNYRGTAVL
jgi:hypothetical protein